jgi:hypothetical protein
MTKTVTVGPRHAVTMTLTASGELFCNWNGPPPTRLSMEELNQYLAARNRLIGEMREALARSESIDRAYARAHWEVP